MKKMWMLLTGILALLLLAGTAFALEGAKGKTVFSQSYALGNIGHCAYDIGEFYSQKYKPYYYYRPQRVVHVWGDVETCRKEGGEELALRVAPVDKSYVYKRYGPYPLGYVPKHAMQFFGEDQYLKGTQPARFGMELHKALQWDKRYGATDEKPSFIYGYPTVIAVKMGMI